MRITKATEHDKRQITLHLNADELFNLIDRGSVYYGRSTAFAFLEVNVDLEDVPETTLIRLRREF